MRQNKVPVPLFNAFRSTTTDIISEYIYGESLGLMEREDWAKSFCDVWRDNFLMGAVVKQVPWFSKIMAALPDWVMLMINPKMIEVFASERQAQALTEQLLPPILGVSRAGIFLRLSGNWLTRMLCRNTRRRSRELQLKHA